MNNKQQNGKELLKKAFVELDREYVENFLEIEAELFAEIPKRKMRRRRLHKRIAVIAAALLIFFSTATMLVKGEDFTRWVLDFYETNVKIHFQDDDVQKAPATIETIYMPTYIPGNYQLQFFDKNINNTSIQIRWKKSTEDYIEFYQDTFNGEEIIDTQDTNYSEIYHNNIKFISIKKYGFAQYVWHTEEYRFLLIIYPHESDEENFKIIDSIQKYENTDNREFLK